MGFVALSSFGHYRYPRCKWAGFAVDSRTVSVGDKWVHIQDHNVVCKNIMIGSVGCRIEGNEKSHHLEFKGGAT